MAFKHFLIFICLLIISSCAEVGTISGGPKDETPPKIVKSSLQNGTTNFNENKVEITFDEFIQLNKPNENIFLVPSHSRVESQLIKKTLRINFKEVLQKNTTYTLYLNAAVKDVTEGNDSLMQFTFSTGPMLDSLKFTARTIDAFSNRIKSKITVALYDSLNAEKPIYFGQTNQTGIVSLSAIKEGTYFCKAFDDKNKDLTIQKDESQAWNYEPITINGNVFDTINFALSTPIQPDKIKNAKLIPPGIIGLHIPNGTAIDQLSINGKDVPTDKFWKLPEDSMHVALGNQQESEFQLIVNSDTFNLRRLEKNKMSRLNPKNITKENEISTISTFEVMDFIESIDTNKIEVLKLPDSIKVNSRISFEQNRLSIQPTDKGLKKYIINFKDGAITGLTGKKNSVSKVEITTREEREFGSLHVKFKQPIDVGILQLVFKEKVVDEKKITSKDKSVIFTRLNPGEYSFRIIEDLNQNNQWDPISPEKRTEPERVFLFSTPIKVRANWEVETELELKE
jgi:uncharacterized protein (DUF2141 family)